MHVLVDYDNIAPHHRNRGVRHVLFRIAEALGKLPIPPPRHLTFRFYGGWFFGDQLTSAGQMVSSQLQQFGVTRIPVAWSKEPAPADLLVSGTIARSLAAMDMAPIYHTLRRRPFEGTIYFTPHQACQGAHACPLSELEAFFRHKKCPTLSCEIQQHDVLSRSEQKLVDTMLVSDLLYFASRSNAPLVAVVSSDDDMWPGVRTAMTFRQPIIQVHTSPRSSPHHSYTQRISANAYLQTSIA